MPSGGKARPRRRGGPAGSPCFGGYGGRAARSPYGGTSDNDTAERVGCGKFTGFMPSGVPEAGQVERPVFTELRPVPAGQGGGLGHGEQRLVHRAVEQAAAEALAKRVEDREAVLVDLHDVEVGLGLAEDLLHGVRVGAPLEQALDPARGHHVQGVPAAHRAVQGGQVDDRHNRAPSSTRRAMSRSSMAWRRYAAQSSISS